MNTASRLKSIGWQHTEAGHEFIATLVFPAGPPHDLMFGAVWNKTPVFLRDANDLKPVKLEWIP